jgi:hypothetical protein
VPAKWVASGILPLPYSIPPMSPLIKLLSTTSFNANAAEFQDRKLHSVDVPSMFLMQQPQQRFEDAAVRYERPPLNIVQSSPVPPNTHKHTQEPTSTQTAHSSKIPKCDKCRQKGKVRPFCVPCGGSRICSHGKEKRRCKLCGGRGICPHSRDRHRCKECSGASLCTHGREKRTCKECGGAGICIHGRRKTRCKICSSSPGNTAPSPPGPASLATYSMGFLTNFDRAATVPGPS